MISIKKRGVQGGGISLVKYFQGITFFGGKFLILGEGI